MTLAHPLAMLWGLLAIPIVLLYLRSGKPPKEPTATGMFWQQVLAEQSGQAAWQPWRRRVSLGVQLIVLALMVIAMAEPVGSASRRIVLILDNSTESSDVDDATDRFNGMKQDAQTLVDGLHPRDRVAIVTTAGAVNVQCNFTGERAMLGDAIGAISASNAPSRPDQAKAAAEKLLSTDTDGQVVIFPTKNGVPKELIASGMPPVWLCLVVFGVVILAVEWGFYQRRWMC